MASVGHDGTARIWVAPGVRNARVSAELVLRGDGSKKSVDFPAMKAGEESVIGTIAALRPNAIYDWTVNVQGTTSSTAEGSFRTAPLAGAPFRATFGVVSCMNAQDFPSQLAWPHLMAEEPSLLIQLGDNTYAGGNRPARARGFHHRQRAVPEYRSVLLQVPIIAVWDDHDYRGNEGDKHEPDRDVSLSFFKEMFPNPGAGLSDVPGLFFALSYGDVDIFLVDVRYHRDAPADPNPERSILGDAQMAWLESRLRASTAKFKLIGSGSTIGTGEAWSSYPRDLDRVFLLTRDVPGIIFLTGDLHRSLFTRWDRGAYPVHEITSSGVGVKGRVFSYATLAIDTTLPDAELRAVVTRVEMNGQLREKDELLIRASELRAR
jgi:alkaline phosphatase D